MNSSAVGQRFGKLVALAIQNSYAICQCDCGNFHVARKRNVASGVTKSCGCLARHILANGLIGLRHGKAYSPVNNTWGHMRQRCENPRDAAYENYGGRGIKVCERWQKFENFYADMGEKPDGMSLDRIDNDGNYEPENCRWATRLEQSNNRRNNIFIEYRGERLNIAQWGKRLGVRPALLRKRIHLLGWSVEKAMTTPVRTSRATRERA